MPSDSSDRFASSVRVVRIVAVVSAALAVPVPAQEPDHGTGLIFMEAAIYQAMAAATAPLMGTLPPAADMSADFPVPGDQGRQGSCVGWSVAYALKTYHERRERGWSLSDPAHVFSPSFVYNQIRRSDSCQAGTDFRDALELLKTVGAAPLSTFPTTDAECSRRPSEAVRRAARSFTISDWKRLPSMNPVDVKAHLASGFPVLIGMTVDEAFQGLRGSAVYSARMGKELGGHAMVLVGYDDRRGAYKVMNSWGTRWGDGGFGWIDYGIAMATIGQAFVAQDEVRPPVQDRDDSEEDDEESDDEDSEEIDEEDVVVLPPAVSALRPSVQFDVPVNSQFGVLPGISVGLRGGVQNLTGRNLTIVVRFTHADAMSTPLFASPADMYYRDVFGHVASQGSWTIGGPNVSFETLGVQIPYAALATMNFAATNYQTMVAFRVYFDVYVDAFHVARSEPVDMWMRW